VSAPPLSLAFFDPVHDLHGTLRSGTCLLFRAGAPSAEPRGPDLSHDGESVHAVLDGRLDLRFTPLAERADLGGAAVRPCRVEGQVDGETVTCLGTVGETLQAPRWEELDAVRAVSAVFDEERAVLAVLRRARGSRGHEEDEARAVVVAGGRVLTVEDARLSTVYDGAGRQRSAGFELWVPEEDGPRRASGQAVAGASLELEGVHVQTAVFAWRMEGREGFGTYDLTFRAEPRAAA
jgi:hypothetical protein